MWLFQCECGWSYVITLSHVYGPIMGVSDGASVMTRLEFEQAYGECARILTPTVKHYLSESGVKKTREEAEKQFWASNPHLATHTESMNFFKRWRNRGKS